MESWTIRRRGKNTSDEVLILICACNFEGRIGPISLECELEDFIHISFGLAGERGKGLSFEL